jgi:hypothetical protein
MVPPMIVDGEQPSATAPAGEGFASMGPSMIVDGDGFEFYFKQVVISRL